MTRRRQPHEQLEAGSLIDDDPGTGDFTDVELWQLCGRWTSPEDGRPWRSATYRFHGLVAAEWTRGRVRLATQRAACPCYKQTAGSAPHRHCP